MPGRFLAPAANASASTGALCGSVAKPGPQVGEQRRRVGEERLIAGLSAITAWNVGGVSEIDSCRYGYGDAGERA